MSRLGLPCDNSADCPLGGTVITGSARSIFGGVFGQAPRVACDEARDLADIRISRTNHTRLTVIARAFPITAASTREKMARHRWLVSQAVMRVRIARRQIARAA